MKTVVAPTNRSTRPAEPAAPVAEVKAWLLGDPATGQWIEVDGYRVEYSRGMGTPAHVLASAFQAERARADELRRERDFWENRENEALHRLAAAEQRAADALARAENAADWRPIEAAPKGRVPFLALNYDGEIHVAAYDEHGRLMRRSHSAYRPQSFSIENGRKILISETEEWRNDWSLWTRLYEFKPTHWRPLPFLPRAAREAQPATDGGDNG